MCLVHVFICNFYLSTAVIELIKNLYCAEKEIKKIDRSWFYPRNL